MVQFRPPMLAVSSKVPAPDALKQLSASGEWWLEVKLDGIRALMSIDAHASVTIINRRGRDITFRYPDVVVTWGRSGFVGTLDGEIICLDANAKPDFTRIHRRDAQGSVSGVNRLLKTHPAVFVPFDVLDVAGRDTRSLAYTSRHELLVQQLGVERVSFASTDGEAMWAYVIEHGLEGLMAKLGSATYRSGRQRSWVKLKATKRALALVGGYTAGKGSRTAVGALGLFLWDPEAGALVSVGSVGSGMTDADTREVVRRLEAGLIVVVEVEYLEISPSGKLRMPVFKQIRPDVDASECVVGSLK